MGDGQSGLGVGEKTRSMGRTITEGEFSLLNTLTWSISELHTNETLMAGTPFGTRLLAGPILLAVVTGLHESSDGLRLLKDDHGVELTRALTMAGHYRAPVVAGDTIWVDTELVSTSEDADGSGGELTFHDIAVNHRNEIVVEVDRRYRFDRVAPAIG